MKALILAGGFAKRLWPLTTDKAKPLLPVAGKPVISHIVENIPQYIPIVVSTNERFAQDFAHWQSTHADRDITLFVEPVQTEETKKGALAAVALAIQSLGINDDLLIIGGDNFFTFSIEEFLSAAAGQPMMAVFDVQKKDEAKKFGVVVCDGTRITGFQEKPNDPASTLVASACFWIPARHIPDVLQAAQRMPDKLGGMFGHFLERGIEAHAHALPGYWNDIGSFEGYLEAHRHAGADLSIPKHLLSPSLGNTFEGVNHIDPHVTIQQSRIQNSIILEGAEIINSVIEGAIIDRHCRVQDTVVKEQIIR